MASIEDNNSSPTSPKDTVLDIAEDTDDGKLDKLDQLLNKTNIYSTFISEKFKASKTYGTTAVAANAPLPQKEGSSSRGRGSRKRKNEGEANQKSLQQKVDEVSSSDTQTLTTQPPLITGGLLREYQLTGVNWMIGLWENGMNGILADEMGLGKTIQVISFLSHLWEKGVKGPFLIVAPLSTLPNWEKEFKKWCSSVPIMVYHDTKELRGLLRDKLDVATANKRRRLSASSDDAAIAKGKGKPRSSSFVDEGVLPVIITSYDIAINDRKYLQKYKWKYLVVDEAHRLKNFECKLICELRQLHTDNRLLLTGTPLQNNLTELWSLLNFILPEIFDNVTNFQKWFDFTEVLEAKGQEGLKDKDKATPHQSLIKKLHDILRPFLLRRLKTDVELSLPKKREIVVYCTQTAPQKSFYNAARMKDLTANKGKPIRLANLLMHLRKVCNHPFLFEPDVTKHYLCPSSDTQNDSDEIKPVADEKIDIDAPRKLRQRKDIKYSDDYDEYEFDRMMDELEEAGETEEEPEEKSKAADNVAEKPKRLRSGYNLFMREQYAKLRDKGVSSANLGETAKLIGKNWTNLSTEEKEKYQQKVDEQMELFDNIINPYKDDDPVMYKKALLNSCGKLGLLDRMLPMLKKDGHKVLIFSQMTRLLDILEDYLELYNYKYCRIDGGVGRKEREQQIEAFNTDQEVFIFLLSTRAGGVGINLAAADTVIIYDSDWNPQMDLQAQDRCHRIGQTRPVVVYRLITAGSVEEHILARAKSKLRLENLVITKGQFNVERVMDSEKPKDSVEDIADILRLDQEDVAVGKKGEISDKRLNIIMNREKCFGVEGENEGFEVLEEMLTEF